jgi:hypothetical protein
MKSVSVFGFTILYQRDYKSLLDKLGLFEREYQQALNFLTSLEQSDYKLLPKENANEASPLMQRLMSFQKTIAKLISSGDEVRWHDAGMAKFNDILTHNFDDQQALYDQIVVELSKYVNANQAALFLIEDLEKQDSLVRMEACYAYDRKKFLNRSFPRDENLVGQSILERNTIFMTNVPQFYTRITSGLGEATPGCILIVPLFNETDVVGAIELASFKKFTNKEIKFVETLGKSITASIYKMRQTQDLKVLFKKSEQAQSEIRQKEEEIRQQMEELQATNEEMSRKSKELTRLGNELETKNVEIELIRKQEKELLESKLEAQKHSYELIINRLKSKLQQQNQPYPLTISK